MVKLEPHKKARFVKLLAVNDFSLHGRPLVDGSNLYLIAWLPAMGGTDANALGTEIIGIGLFFDFARLRRQSQEPNHHHDREPFFRPAGQILSKMHTFTYRARNLAAKARGVAPRRAG